MSDDRFTKLFKHLEDFRKEVNVKFNYTNYKISNIEVSLQIFLQP